MSLWEFNAKSQTYKKDHQGPLFHFIWSFRSSYRDCCWWCCSLCSLTLFSLSFAKSLDTQPVFSLAVSMQPVGIRHQYSHPSPLISTSPAARWVKTSNNEWHSLPLFCSYLQPASYLGSHDPLDQGASRRTVSWSPRTRLGQVEQIGSRGIHQPIVVVLVVL